MAQLALHVGSVLLQLRPVIRFALLQLLPQPLDHLMQLVFVRQGVQLQLVTLLGAFHLLGFKLVPQGRHGRSQLAVLLLFIGEGPGQPFSGLALLLLQLGAQGLNGLAQLLQFEVELLNGLGGTRSNGHGGSHGPAPSCMG